MSLTALTYLVVGATFVLYIYIAIKSRASSTGEFYVAGKGVHPVVNGMATAADWMSAAFISCRTYCLYGLSRRSIFNGVDWGLRFTCIIIGTLSQKIWKIYCSRIYWR